MAEQIVTKGSHYPLVSVGIPTYNRPETLERALASLARQDYPKLEIIIGDNGSDDDTYHKIVAQYSGIFESFLYIKHEEDIGPARNFIHLRDVSHGEYFMWLADDDEIGGRNYISSLADALMNDSDLACAFAPWRCMISPSEHVDMPIRDYNDHRWQARVIKFIMWYTSDDFTYGLFRASIVKSARFIPFWGILKGSVIDSAYPFLLKVVLSGKITCVSAPGVNWISHGYSTKGYHKPEGDGIIRYILQLIIRRINVHYLYMGLIGKHKGWAYVALFIVPSIFSITMGYVSVGVKLVNRRNIKRFIFRIDDDKNY